MSKPNAIPFQVCQLPNAIWNRDQLIVVQPKTVKETMRMNYNQTVMEFRTLLDWPAARCHLEGRSAGCRGDKVYQGER